ncbi:MAG TPA: class I SAM-dependent methyltransferase [Solirubrobacteraceae bacterium]|nr:class I SAM-dependent methyltransferase [Solirubrobacteraceae bacterium]
MPSPEYHEALWETLPAGLDPSDYDLRRRFLLDNVAAGERILDVGCGEGRFAADLAAAGVSVVGLDVAEEPLRRARARQAIRGEARGEVLGEGRGEVGGEARAGALDLRLVEPDREWPLPDASFDAVWAGEVIEHVADTGLLLSEARRVLVPGGRLLLSTPNHGRLVLSWLALSRRAFDRHFDPLADHLRFYTRPGLSGLLERFGFREVSVRAAAGPPGARRLLLCRAVRERW